MLVQVQAAGVNPVDTYIRSGAYKKLPPLPYTPGKDGAGVIEQVGEGVHSVKVWAHFLCSIHDETDLLDRKKIVSYILISTK